MAASPAKAGRRPIRIAPIEATRANAEMMLELREAAFGPDPLTELLSNSSEVSEEVQQARREYRIERNLRWMQDPNWRYRQAIDADNFDGPMLGCAQWYWSTDPEHDDPEDPFGPPPPGVNLECFDASIGKLHRWRAAYFAQRKQPFLYMCIIVVRPDVQRCGIGAALLRDGLAEADRLNQPAFIEATPAGLGLYRKFGWEESVSSSVNLKDFGGDDVVCTLVGLVRPPGAEDRAGS